MSHYDIFDVFDIPMSKTLGRTYECYIELTLNYPRTYHFKRRCYDTQKQMYFNMLDYLKIRFPVIDSYEAYIENCGDGLPHIHALIKCRIAGPYSAEGLVMDFVRALLSMFPKRTQDHSIRYHYNNFLNMYRSPPICINYKDEIPLGWVNYIKKNIKNI